MSLKKRLGFTNDPIFLMDGTAFVYRGFYANRNLQRSDGFPTNALYVMTRILLRILREERPTHFVFVMDGKGKNFRHKLFPLYKANRDATPEELVRQLEPIQRMVKALGITLEVSDECEADDCIASLAARYHAEHPVVIVGADKDLRQCLNPQVVLWDPAAKEEKLVTDLSFRQETGLAPAQWPDIQALMGDTSDNIPGVPGIGPKTAEKIFSEFSSLEDIRDRLEQLPPKLRDKIAPHVEVMFLYRQLTTLSTNFSTHLNLEAMRVNPIQSDAAASILQEFELLSLKRELESMLRSGIITSVQESNSKLQQGSLFSASPAPSLPTVSDVSQLLPCHDLPIAILPASITLPEYRTAAYTSGEKSHYVVAIAGQEYIYAGDPKYLVEWANSAAQIVTADVKYLFHNHNFWHSITFDKWFDLGLAAYLCNPEERDYGWPRLAAHWHSAASANTPGKMALAMAAQAAQQLAELHLDSLFYDLEMPLISILASMEKKGVAIDISAFENFLHEVQTELQLLTQQIYAEAGGPFNIRSAQQLGKLLFTKLQLAASAKTPGGQLSTAQDALEKLAGEHPIIDTVLSFRTLEKLRSTYLEPLPRLVDEKGRIHCTFNQLATATGRLSSSNPNMQNIPVRGPFGKRMRSCFIAAPGFKIISADYSQVELRVLAHMSQDPTLITAFQEGKDIHTSTAALIFNVPLEAVTSEQRRNAKTINFGLVYGMGAQKLAQELKISLGQAKDFIDQYFGKLSKLKAFYDNIEEQAKLQGYVTTLAGRRRILPDIRSTSGQKFALARRQAINTVIQGSAADIIKLAMLAVQNDLILAEANVQLLLQVHDELLFEVPDESAAMAGARVADLMASVKPGGKSLTIPLVVDWGLGLDWGDAH